MYGNWLLLFSIFFCGSLLANSGNQKWSLNAEKRIGDLDIDGQLNEAAWLAAPVATDFIQLQPNPGKSSRQKTEVKVLYDDEFMYVGAHMYDSAPDSILSQLSARDQLENTDFFGFWISSFRDGINAFEFFVTPAGIQLDAQVSTFGEDFNWNAVWQCNTSLTDDGWIAEFKIPYSALRFPDQEEQVWDVNFTRVIRRHREQSFWRTIDPKVDGLIIQSGVLKNILNIQPPTRLFFYPYASAYYDTYSEDDGSTGSTASVNGGMDVKYGINEAFTLDMTLIPDFGQAQSDNLVLNLSPFEVQFNENRQFFTEGVELFSKGDLFYSRRIGEYPINAGDAFDQLEEDEEVVSLPSITQPLNVSKISGRNKDGLGVGILNAVVNSASAVVKDSEGQEREVEVAPMSNYNIIVLDQNLKNNSFISLINTNVIRNGSTYDANVIGTSFGIRNKENSILVVGNGAYNKKFNYDPDTDEGFAGNISVEKISGQLNFGWGALVESEHYDINDMGFLFAPNEMNTWAYVAYNIFEPFGRFNRFFASASANYNRLYSPNTFTSWSTEAEARITSRGFHTYQVEAFFQPQVSYDYFEPRKDGAFLEMPGVYSVGGWISSDYRRRIAIDYGTWFQNSTPRGWQGLNYRIAPRFRVNDKLFITYVYSKQGMNQELGYTSTDDENRVIIGTRDVSSHTNVLNLSYIFTNRMGLTFRARHYWSTAKYHSFAYLDDGLSDFTDLGGNYGAERVGLLGDDIQTWERDGEVWGMNEDGSTTQDRSFNAFNIDLVYTWVFSPGSELRIVWKNAILDQDFIIPEDFGNNIDRTRRLPQNNSFSVKVLFFIDYLTLKRRGSSIQN
jgi:hypothetical protein